MNIIEFYKFDYSASGSEQTFYWTTSDVSVDWDGETWEPVSIARQAPGLEQSIEEGLVDLAVPLANPLAQLWRDQETDRLVTVVIFRGERVATGPANVAQFWQGRVKKIAYGADGRAVLKCTPRLVDARRTMPVGRYSQSCRWALYSTGCGVSTSVQGEDGEVSSVTSSERTVRVMLAEQFDEGWFQGGYLELGGVRRFIMASTAGEEVSGEFRHELTLNRWLPAIKVGSLVTVLPGCDHTTDDCGDKFSNLNRYGGFPFIPGRNPWRGN